MTSEQSPTVETARYDVAPASIAQQQLFFIQQLLDGEPTYHVPLFFTLRGPLDQDALRRAIQQAGERHEALRTHFALVDGGLRQVIDTRWRLDWRVGDHLDDAELTAWMTAQATRPFDLERAPLFRAALLRRDDTTATLVLAMHHIICDGWSVTVLLEDILAGYRANIGGGGQAPPEPEFQYGDYASWQQEWLASAEAARQLDFWSETLGGDLPVVQLPADLPAGAETTGGGSLRFDLPGDAIDALRTIAKAADTTVSTALLAVFHLVLGAYTGLDDVIVGVPMANRERAEFERTVGVFVNLVPIRTDLGGRPSFRELLDRVRRASLRAHDHHEVPFETVVQHVSPARAADHDPIVQVLFMMVDAAQAGLSVGELEIIPVGHDTSTAKFQVSLEVDEHGAQPTAVLEYRSDLFSPAWAERFAGHYRTAVAAVAARPDLAVADAFPAPVAERADRPAETERPGPVDDDATPYVAPRDDVERALADIWAATLNRAEIGIDDNYFEVGGDSIRSIQILARAREHGLAIRLPDLMLNQTIRELAPLVTPIDPQDGEQTWEPFDLIGAADRALLPAGVADAYPLTALQAGMLYHSELTAAHQIYHNVAGYHIRATYSEDAWRSAVEALLSRHEVLRTSFAMHGFSEALQLVRDEVTAPITFEDIRSVAPAEQAAEVARRFRWEREHPFDWERAPLIRFHVQRRADDAVQLWIVEHHAIMDGWSARSLFGELLTRYLDALGGDPTTPPPPASRFRSLVRLEREALDSAEQRQFWLDQLDGAPVTTVPRSSNAGSGAPDMAISGRDLPSDLSAEVVRLAGALAVPVRIVLLAVHLRVLAMLGGDSDVVTGVVYNGRVEETDGDRVAGLFLNTLPFRCRLDEGSWVELIGRVAETDLAIQPNRRFPMPEIQRRLGSTALFETYFNYTHFHVEDERPTGELTVLDEDGDVPTSFPFGVEFSRDTFTGRVGVGLRYDAALFTGADIDRIHGYYLAAVRAMVTGPHTAHRTAALLSETELAELADWNDTDTDYPRPHLLHRLVEQQARETPELPAVTFEGGTLTYRELDAYADRLAARLVDLGVRQGQFVGVYLERSPELVLSLLAILKAGGAYVPIDPDNPVARIDTMVADVGAAVVLTAPALLDRLRTCGASAETVELAKIAAEPDPETRPAGTATPDDPAYLMFTSGSTGRPKGVVISHRAICNRLLWMQDEFGLGPDDRVMQKTPYSFDVSVWEFFWPLMQGALLVLARPGGHRDPEYLAGLIRDQAVTTIHFVPSMLRAFLDHDPAEEHASLRLVISSGEALGHDLQERFLAGHRAELVNLYGPTEAAVDVTCWRCRQDDRRIVPIGHPIANLRTHVLDDAMTPVPVGVTGQLHLGGVGLSDGYHGQPELTGERFVDHAWPGGQTERLYRTGDLVRWLPDGELEFLGRADQQVKIRGFRIELGEIEAVLAEDEFVRECVVALREDRLVAYVVPTLGAEVDTPRLRAWLATRLPDHMIPSAWLALDELPLSANGKVDRGRLPEAGPPERTAHHAPPTTDAQRRLVVLWEDVLGVRPIGIHDGFFELGGHSLLALRLVMLIRKEFGRKFPVADLLANDTVAKLAEALARLEKAPGDAARMLPIRSAGEREPLSLIHPVGGGVFCYLPLVAELTAEHPVYGVISEGLVSGTVLNATVEDIAASYLTLLVDKQPTGPYHVGGWSFGAVLAFEVASQLVRRGEEVALLCMIDAAYPGQFEDSLRDEDIALLLFVDVLRAAGMAVPEDVDDEWAEVLAGFDTLQEKMRWLVGRLPAEGSGHGGELEQWEAYFKVFSTNLMAHNNYQPDRYPGDVTYIEGLDGGSIDSAEMWGKVVDGEFRSHTVGAHHYDILQAPHVRETARIVNEALGGPNR
ncbi:non-ribosomal peptide synthetase [Solihabitans fulvus]|uniref:non-ribosomal peptide synthetase n=1 Tax=Solihabitans fulvus TaxID=1892852 RepID=UPI001661ED8F|nr:non-ribosomal peptide synthetase [Solihabitans fulvus]